MHTNKIWIYNCQKTIKFELKNITPVQVCTAPITKTVHTQNGLKNRGTDKEPRREKIINLIQKGDIKKPKNENHTKMASTFCIKELENVKAKMNINVDK